MPTNEGGKTRSFRTSGLTAFLVVGVCCVLVAALTLVALVYTPLAEYVSIPNPELERKYGREITETQMRLTDLSKDVLTLKLYNLQLRRALGDQSARDTSLAQGASSPMRTPADGNEGSISRTQGAQLPSAAAYGREQLVRADMESVRGAVIAARAPSSRITFPLLPPAEGFISQHFDPVRNHFGIDFAGKQGAPIFAAADGYVVFSGWTYDDGNMLIISHGDKYMTVYKHNQSLFKSAHSIVKRGEVIGALGTTGHTSLGPHLHFEVWKDGIPHDPEEYIVNVQKIH